MPHWFEYDRSHGILRCRVEGEVDDAEVRRFHRVARALGEQLRPRAGILDLTAVTAFEVSAEAVQQLAAAPPAFGDSKLARLVVAPQPNIYGLTRMFQQLRGETRPNIVLLRQAAEAYALLGVPAPQFETIAEPVA